MLKILSNTLKDKFATDLQKKFLFSDTVSAEFKGEELTNITTNLVQRLNKVRGYGMSFATRLLGVTNSIKEYLESPMAYTTPTIHTVPKARKASEPDDPFGSTSLFYAWQKNT